ncbi:MAG: hypothetical protein V7637_1635 [Mycobacteriales bacterium]
MPAHLDAAAYRGPLVEAAPGQILLHVPPVGRFLARPVGPVLVARRPGVGPADLACFLAGPVGAGTLLLRGQLTLQAAAVAVAGAGVLICGSPGSGKSVLAAALAGRGHGILADRVAFVTRSRAEPAAVVRPVDPWPQLWPAGADLLGLAPAGGRAARPGLDRRVFELGPAAGPVPLRLVVLLSSVAELALRLDETRHAPGLAGLTQAAVVGREWHRRLVEPLGLAPARFRWLAGLAAARLVRVSGQRTAPPATLAARVEELLR